MFPIALFTKQQPRVVSRSILRKASSPTSSLLIPKSSIVSTWCGAYLLVGVATVATFLLYHTYTYAFWRYEFVQQAATASLFAGIGDVLAQMATERPETRKPYDARRTVHFVLKGFGGGIMWNAWYRLSDPLSLFLAHQLLGSTAGDATIPTTSLSSKALATTAAATIIDPVVLLQAVRVGTCIVLEQCLVSPLFYTVWDIPLPALLSGVSTRHIPAQIYAKLGPLLLANAKIWTPSNLITYNLPTEYRVLFASCIDVLWQIVCSKITSCDAVEAVTLPTATADTSPSTKDNDVRRTRSLSESVATNSCSSRRSPTRFLSSACTVSIPTQFEIGGIKNSPTLGISNAPDSPLQAELYP